MRIRSKSLKTLIMVSTRSQVGDNQSEGGLNVNSP